MIGLLPVEFADTFGEYTLEQNEGDERLDLTNNLRRKLIWDSLPCDMATEEIANQGLFPASEEGTEYEHRASHRRMAALGPVIHPLGLVSSLAGEIIAKTILGELEIEPDDEDYEDEFEVYKKAVLVGGHIVVAQLLAMGYLETSEGSLDQ